MDATFEQLTEVEDIGDQMPVAFSVISKERKPGDDGTLFAIWY